MNLESVAFLTEKSREFEKAVLSALYEATPEGIIIVDQSGTIVSHNQRLLQLFRINPEKIGRYGKKDFSGEQDSLLLNEALKLIKNKKEFLERIDFLYKNPNKKDLFEVELTTGQTFIRYSIPLFSDDKYYIGRVWFFRDATESKKMERLLYAYSYEDPMTGVPNRRQFSEQSEKAFSRTKRHSYPLSFVTFDIDYFKSINDQFGHPAGDEVIRNFCDKASRCIRKEDLFARTGGEEFTAMITDTNESNALILAERIREVASSKFITKDGFEIRYTVSGGLAEVRPEDKCVQDVLSRADKALYQAKKSGRNCCRLSKQSYIGSQYSKES